METISDPNTYKIKVLARPMQSVLFKSVFNTTVSFPVWLCEHIHWSQQRRNCEKDKISWNWTPKVRMCNWDSNTEQAKAETEKRNRLLFKHLGSVEQRLKFDHLKQRQIVWTGPFSRVGEHLQYSPSHYFKRPSGSLVHSRKVVKKKKVRWHKRSGCFLDFPWLMAFP